MKSPKVLAATTGLLALVGTGTGTAYAASNHGSRSISHINSPTSAPAQTPTTTVPGLSLSANLSAALGSANTQNGGTTDVQQGDQSAPDTATSGDTGAVAEAPDASDQGSATPADQASSTETSSSAAENNADGPGGHQDPAGNVDHQFQGNE